MSFDSQEPLTPEKHPIKSVFQGMLLLGKGKKEGICFFSTSTEGLLNAMAPWIAVSLVVSCSSLLTMMVHNKKQVIFLIISQFLVNLCMILSVAVITHGFSSLWKLTTSWQRAVTATLWCQWMPIIDLIIFSLMIGTLFAFSLVYLGIAIGLLMVFIFAYAMWIAWFSLKSGLDINGKRAALLVGIFLVIKLVLGTVSILCNPISHEQFQVFFANLNS